jgi:hypothetical protein
LTKHQLKFLFLLGFVLINLVACTANRGIVLGNPILEGKKLRLVPESSENVYLVSFVEKEKVQIEQYGPSNLSVSRISKNTKSFSLIQTLIVPYTQNASQVMFEATFSNSQKINCIISFSGTVAVVSSVAVAINSQTTDTIFDIENKQDICDSASTNYIEKVVDSFCTLNTGCNGNITCSECRPQVLAAQVAGSDGAPSSTFQNLVQAFNSGNITLTDSIKNTCFQEIQALACPDLATISSSSDINSTHLLPIFNSTKTPFCVTSFNQSQSKSNVVPPPVNFIDQMISSFCSDLLTCDPAIPAGDCHDTMLNFQISLAGGLWGPTMDTLIKGLNAMPIPLAEEQKPLCFQELQSVSCDKYKTLTAKDTFTKENINNIINADYTPFCRRLIDDISSKVAP